MTTGALIFAFNNEHTDYVRLAAWSAANIRRHLGIPVAVVTNMPDHDLVKSSFDVVIAADAESGGTRYFSDIGHSVTWYNAGRVDAYALSPWDQTLVLDADYVVAGDELKRVLSMPQAFACHRWSKSVDSDQNFYQGNNWVGSPAMPMYWATVMMFRRSPAAEYIFDCMNMVRNNWSHYRDLYGIDRATYRNDYALSIALGIVAGHTQSVDAIPWTLLTVLPEHQITSLETDFYEVTYQDSHNRLKYLAFNGVDIHVMCKHHLENLIANT
jgi:hypothetical protein